MPAVETLTHRIGVLVSERQALRIAGAERDRLERNREQLVSCQWQLARALIERHRPGAFVAA